MLLVSHPRVKGGAGMKKVMDFHNYLLEWQAVWRRVAMNHSSKANIRRKKMKR